MTPKATTGLFEPILAAGLAGGKFYYENNDQIVQALGVALLGGALGWLGKTIMKGIFMYFKNKWDGRKK